jgi:hypothetical protein
MDTKKEYPHLAFSELTGEVYIVKSKSDKKAVDKEFFRWLIHEFKKYHKIQ